MQGVSPCPFTVLSLCFPSRHDQDRHIANIDTVRREVAAWQTRRDQLKAKINWQFTTDDASIKLSRLYPTFEA
jgi:hypothetical protein